MARWTPLQPVRKGGRVSCRTAPQGERVPSTPAPRPRSSSSQRRWMRRPRRPSWRRARAGIAFVNRALLAVTGHGAEELLGQEAGLLFAEGAPTALELARPNLEEGRVCGARPPAVQGRHALSQRHVGGARPGGVGWGRARGRHLPGPDRAQVPGAPPPHRPDGLGGHPRGWGGARGIDDPLAFVLTNLSFITDALAELPRGEGGKVQEDLLRDITEAVAEVRVGAERVRDIVRDLKIFSRGDDGSRIAVDVQRVLESSIKMAGNEIRHRARLVREYGRDVPPVEAEAARLGQVFLNLVLNAVQAIPEGDAKANENPDHHPSRYQGPRGGGDPRYGRGDPEPGAPPPLRALLHHQAGGGGDRARPLHLPGDRARARWAHRGGERAGGPGRSSASCSPPGANRR